MIHRPRWQKVLADLWGNRARSLLVVTSIAVGLFAIGVIGTVYAVVAGDMRSSYQAVNPANIYIKTSLFDQDIIDQLRKREHVTDVIGVRTAEMRVANKDSDWDKVHFESFKDLINRPLNQVKLISGTWPPADGEIVVEQYKLPALGVKLGDPVTIELASGEHRTLALVGVVQDLTLGSYNGAGGFFNAPVQAFVTQDTLEALDQPDHDTFSGMYITVDSSLFVNQSTLRAWAADLTDDLVDIGLEISGVHTRDSSEHPNGYLVDAIVGVLFVLGLLVVFLSGFLVTNTLQALLAQQTQQIGIMKTVGGRQLQIAGVYVALILVFGLIAFLLAAPAAHWVSYRLLGFLAGTLNFVLLGERVIPGVVILQAVLALIMPQAAAWLPIWRGTRISVQEALSGISQEKGPSHAHLLKGTSSLGRVRLPKPLLIAIRNTFRRKGRLALTLTTLTLGGSVFIATFNVQVSIDKYMDQISRYFLADVNVSLDEPRRTVEIEKLLYQLPDVEYVEGWASARSEIIEENGTVGERVQLLAPPASSQLVEPILLQGRWIKEGDQNAIVLGELFLARYPKLKPGDRITLNVNGEKTDWVVVGFFKFAGKNGGFSAYANYSYLTQRTGQAHKATTFQVVAKSGTSITAAEQDDLARKVEVLLKVKGIKISNLTTGAYLTEMAGGGFAVLTAFMLFLAVLTAVVGSIGLAGTMSMNVMERTREIGVMRAIGASDTILMSMVLVEGLLIGAISYLLSVLFAFPISKILSDSVSLAIFDSRSDFGFTLSGFLIWLAVVVVLSFLASVLPARNAARLTIREVLAYE